MPTEVTATPAPRMLGRGAELSALLAHLGLDGGRGGGAALVAGDAGMGKTTLLAALTGRARAAGWRVMVGHCLDLADLLLPYLPFSELVGRLADEDPETARRLVAEHPAVAALAPGRRLMDAGPDGARTPADEPGADPGLGRAELFAAVQAMLDTLAREGPVLVVVEDLHWSDRSTRDLLSFLLGRSLADGVALVGSYRSDDLHRRHPLRGAVAEWVRLPGVLRLELGPLPDPVLRDLVRALHPHPLAERDVAAVVERAEGNAFLAEELVGAMATGAAPGELPAALADLLLVRLDGLGDAARSVVRAAACSGRRVTHRLLAAVLDLPETELEGALREAVDGNVLVRTGDDGYAFRHALLAEAVYDDLLPGERVRLHARYAEALDAHVVPGTAAELATHARAAHDVGTALRAAARAGEEAMAVGGPDDAARHFETALELLARPGSPAGAVDLPDLVTRAVEALVATGQPARATALAREHLDRDLAPDDRARLLLALTSAALAHETTDEPVAETAEALGLLGDQPGRLRARALSLHARALANGGRDQEAAAAAGEALAAAQRLQLPAVAAEATTTLATLEVRSGDLDGALHALQRVVAEAAAAEDTDAVMRGRYHLALVHLERGRLADAEELFGSAAAAAEAAGRPWAPYGFDARYHHAMTAYLRGRWDEALARADVAGQSPPADAEALLLSVRTLVAAGRGDGSALRLLDQLRGSWPREGLVAANTGAAAVDLLGDAGDLDGAVRVHDEVVAHLARAWSPLFHAQVRLAALLLGRLALGVRRLPTRERGRVRDRADRLLAAVEAVERHTAGLPRGFGPEGLAWIARARAEHLRVGCVVDGPAVSPPALVEAWGRSVDLFDTLGQPFEAARSRAGLAAALALAGRATDAAREAAGAREVASALGAAPLLHELDEGPGPARRGASRPDGTPGALTPREQDVLGLLALGRSNGEIGRDLFISTKTVSVHVSNILAKLGAAGRTEAVALARRRGLLDD